MKVIKIKKYIHNTDKVLAGREKGLELQKSLKINQYNMEKKLLLVFPKQIQSINESFFIGLFQGVENNFSLNNFNKTFNFKSSDHIKKDIEDGKKRIFKKK